MAATTGLVYRIMIIWPYNEMTKTQLVRIIPFGIYHELGIVQQSHNDDD